MKKLLIASTALSLAGGAAFAEISISGDAELGVDYNSEAGEGMSKHSFVHEVGIDFSGSGTTDGGLTFGGSAGFDTNDDTVNLGTVHVSGSFGKLTIGDNDPGSFIAGGIADIGMNGIGVDDMAENLRKGTASQLRYDNSFGQVSIAISAGTKAGSAAVAAVPASEWYITDHKMTKHVYRSDYTVDKDGMSALKAGEVGVVATTVEIALDRSSSSSVMPISNAYDKIFGVVYRNNAVPGDSPVAGGVWVDLDGKTDANLAVPDADTDESSNRDQVNIFGFKRDDDNEIVGPEDVEVTADHKKAFEFYEKYYDLGEDEAVGGVDPGSDDEDGKMNADTVKVTDNYKKAAPAVSAETEFAFGMNFETGGVTIGLGYDSNKTISMGAGFSAGEISTNLLYVKMDDDEDTKDMNEEATSMGVDLSYSMGASKVTLAYGRNKPEEGMAMDAVGMGVTHDLGGGATMNAGFGKVDTMVDKKIVSQNKASIGLMFAF